MSRHEFINNYMKRKGLKVKPATPKEREEFFLDMVKDQAEEVESLEGSVRQLEERLEGALNASSKSNEAFEKEKQAWHDEKCRLKQKVKDLEETVKSEGRRAWKALEVAESTADAAGGIGRLLNRIVDNDVMETLRLASVEQRSEARERMRHRSPI